MESGFDKEIDVLLRNAAEVAGAPDGGRASPHPEIDAIAAYAENVIPKASRGKYTEHFADCARCRQVLANLIAMNTAAVAEAEFAAPSGGKIAAAPPKRLFFLPAPVFALGGLLLVVAGFFAYSLLQVPLSGPSEISTFSDSPIAPPPAAEEEPLAANTTPANSTATTAANSASTSAVKPPSPGKTADSDLGSLGRAAASDEKEAEQQLSKPALPKPPAATDSNVAIDGIAERGAAAKLPDELRSSELEKRVDLSGEPAAKAKVAASKGAREDVTIVTAPSAAPETADAVKTDDAKKRNEALNSGRMAAPVESRGPARTIAGKTFENRDGVWYDSAYKGETAIEIRRDTAAYRKLNAELRTIAEELKTTVVVVWKNKAYRIK